MVLMLCLTLKYKSFQFPQHIRNLQKHTINNTFGDAVFVLIKKDQDVPISIDELGVLYELEINIIFAAK